MMQPKYLTLIQAAALSLLLAFVVVSHDTDADTGISTTALATDE